VHLIIVACAVAIVCLLLCSMLYLPLCPSANSERTDQANSGTSSSNESVSSLPLRDINNHNNYAAISPQKSRRGIYQVLKNICGWGQTNFPKNL
jgi:YbbR domain-containing protein